MGKLTVGAVWACLAVSLVALSVSLRALSLIKSGYRPMGPSLAEKVYEDFESKARTGYQRDQEDWLTFESHVPAEPEIGGIGWSVMALAPDIRSEAWQKGYLVLQRNFRYPGGIHHVRVRIEASGKFQVLVVNLVGEDNKGIVASIYPDDFAVGRTLGYRLKDSVLLLKSEEVQTTFADVPMLMPGFYQRTFQKVWFRIRVIPFSALKDRSVLVSKDEVGAYNPRSDEL